MSPTCSFEDHEMEILLLVIKRCLIVEQKRQVTWGFFFFFLTELGDLFVKEERHGRLLLLQKS